MTDPSPPRRRSAPRSRSRSARMRCSTAGRAKAVDTAAGQLGVDPRSARLALPKGAAGMIDAYFDGVDAAMAAHFRPSDRRDEDPRADPRACLVPAADRWPRRARRCAARSRSSPCRRMRRSALAHRLAQRRPDVAAGGRHRDRLQPLYQAADARRASTARPCSPGSTTRARAGPTPPPSSTAGSTTSCASRNGRREWRGSSSAGPASAASSAGCAIRPV